jgi:hypothetical protein
MPATWSTTRTLLHQHRHRPRNLRVAVTQRIQQDGEWCDGDTSFLRVNAWRGQAEHLADDDQLLAVTGPDSPIVGGRRMHARAATAVAEQRASGSRGGDPRP